MKIKIDKSEFYRMLQILFNEKEYEMLFNIIGQNMRGIGVEAVGNLCNRIIEVQKKEAGQ